MIHQRCLGDAWNWISQFFTLKFSVLGGLFYFLFFECVDLTCLYSHTRTLDFSSVVLKIGRVKVIFQQLRFHLSPFAAPRTDLASFSSDLKIVLDHQLVRQSYSWLTSHFWNVNAWDEVSRTFPCSPDSAKSVWVHFLWTDSTAVLIELSPPVSCSERSHNSNNLWSPWPLATRLRADVVWNSLRI